MRANQASNDSHVYYVGEKRSTGGSRPFITGPVIETGPPFEQYPDLDVPARSVGMRERSGRADVYTLRQAAWTLGISSSELSSAIRRGIVRTERRRSQLVVTAAELTRHLTPVVPTDEHDRDDAAHDSRWLHSTLRALDRYRDVPTAVLAEIVVRDCDQVWPDDEAPDGWSDADVARQVCAGCRSPYACLELELRLDGDEPLGVYGGLCEQDRRTLHAAWSIERDERPPSDDDPQGWA